MTRRLYHIILLERVNELGGVTAVGQNYKLAMKWYNDESSSALSNFYFEQLNADPTVQFFFPSFGGITAGKIRNLFDLSFVGV